MKCECQKDSVDHDPGKCNGTAIMIVKRENNEIKVCSDCYLPGDRLLKNIYAIVETEK